MEAKATGRGNRARCYTHTALTGLKRNASPQAISRAGTQGRHKAYPYKERGCFSSESRIIADNAD